MFFKKKKRNNEIYCPVSGVVKSIESSSDPVFSKKMMGDGVVIFPDNGKLYAPCDCVISMLFPTCHALGLTLDNGITLLVHFGIDTVSLNGEGFMCKVSENKKVKKGDLILDVDLNVVREKAQSDEVLIVITENEQKLNYTVNTGDKKACRDIIISFNE